MHLCCGGGDGGIYESPAVEHGRRQNPPPFLEKTYMLLEDPDTDDVVSWTEDGSAFVVWKPAEFSRDVLPSLFKHSNFSSFVRQLNTYGFRKASTTRWEFCNNMFKRGQKSLMSSIYRRKGWSARRQLLCDAPVILERMVAEGSPSPSSSSEYTTLVDENKRLRSQNGALCAELSDVKKKCKELIDMVVSVNRASIGCDIVNGDVDVHVGPMVFGVRLVPNGKSGEKRNRVGIGEPLQFLLSPSS